MTANTPTLSLTLYDSSTDQSVLFESFRATLCGTSTSSNLYKIDTACGVYAAGIAALQTTRGAIYVSPLYSSPNTYVAAGVSGITSISTGLQIILSVDTTTDGTVTLNINSLGAKSLMKANSSGTLINLLGKDLVKGRYYLFRFDGTRWVWVCANTADQINVDGTSGNFLRVSSTNSIEDSTSKPADFAVAAKGVTNGDTHNHVGGDGAAIPEGGLSITDVTTGDATTSAHGFMPKIPAVIAISDAATLDSTALSDSLASIKWHLCSDKGSPADYTLVLPTAASVAGKYLAFRMSTALTKFVTLDGSSTQTIDGELTRIMWAGESCVLVSDGSNWFKVFGKSIPMYARVRATSTQDIATATSTEVELGTSVYDNTGAMVSTAGNSIFTKRPGLYDITGYIRFPAFSNAATNVQGVLLVDATGIGNIDLQSLANTNAITLNPNTLAYPLIAGQEVTMNVYQNSGDTATTGSALANLIVKETPLW
jgi:hypothetical protein